MDVVTERVYLGRHRLARVRGGVRGGARVRANVRVRVGVGVGFGVVLWCVVVWCGVVRCDGVARRVVCATNDIFL